MSDSYAVIGNPIDFSKSPFIHMRFAQSTGQDVMHNLGPAIHSGPLIGNRES